MDTRRNIKAYLRGRYNRELVIPPQAKVLMIELGVKNRFDYMNLPKAVSKFEKAMRIMQRRVER